MADPPVTNQISFGLASNHWPFGAMPSSDKRPAPSSGPATALITVRTEQRRERLSGIILAIALSERVTKVEPSSNCQSSVRPASIFAVIRDGSGHESSIGAWMACSSSFPK
jgi:hypothetical protein